MCAQLRLTHRDTMDCSPPGSSVHGVLQARTLEWVAILWHRNQTHISCIGRQIFFTNEPPGKPHSSLIPPSKPLSFPPPSSAFSFSTVSLCKTLLLFFQAYLTITWELSWLNKLLEWLWKVPSVLGFHLSNESIALDSLPSRFQCQGPVTTNKPDLFLSPLFP